MKKISTLPNSEHIVKCSFCGEKYKENRMLIFYDWDDTLYCCEDNNCRHEFVEIVEYYNVGDEND